MFYVTRRRVEELNAVTSPRDPNQGVFCTVARRGGAGGRCSETPDLNHGEPRTKNSFNSSGIYISRVDAPPPHPPAARWIARHPLDTFSRYTMPQCTLNVGRALRADNVRVPDDLVRDVCQGGNRHNISATLGLQYWTLLKATVSLPGALAVVRVPYITRDTTHLPPWDEFRRRVSPKQVGRTPRKCFLWKYIIADVFPVTHRHSVIRVGVCTIPIVEKISLEIRPRGCVVLRGI